MMSTIIEIITKFLDTEISEIITIIASIIGGFIRLSEIFSNIEKVKIIKAPGYTFSIFGKLIFTKKSYDRVIEPAITMMQEEYFEAYSQKRFAMARWVRFRFFFIFLQILGMNLPLISSLLELKEKFTSK